MSFKSSHFGIRYNDPRAPSGYREFGPITSRESAIRTAEQIKRENPHVWGRSGYRIVEYSPQTIEKETP